MSRKLFVLFIAFPFGLIFSNGYSQTAPFQPMDQIDDFKKTLDEVNKETITLNSEFRQVKHLTILSQDIISKGTFYFKKENKLRWEYTDPFIYTIVFNENNILIRDENRESHYNTESNEMFRQISHLMTNVVRGNILDDTENFSAQFFKNDREYQVKLTPLSEQYKHFFQQIEIFFRQTDLMVARILFLEQSEDNTLIEFFNDNRNEPIPDSVFNIH